MQSKPMLHIVDDDDAVRVALHSLMQTEGIPAQAYASAEDFLEQQAQLESGCLLLDVRMPGMNGFQLQEVLNEQGVSTPIVFITGHGDVDMAVQAIKSGAQDFIEKPFDNDRLIETVKNCLSQSADIKLQHERRKEMQARIELLTKRERQVMEFLVDGKQNKVIAKELNISPRTVELHRAKVMEKLHAHTLPDVVRTALLSNGELFPCVTEV